MEHAHYHEDYRHFRDTLFADLTQNLKPVIISLTMLAEDYCRSDIYISKAIEEYIDQVSPDIKILGLYLIDSIMKNFKTNTSYIKIFERNIISLFERVFRAVDENNRKALYKLRQTWIDLFTVETLYELDVRIKRIDNAWPITAVIPAYVPTAVKPIREVPQPQQVVKKPEPPPPPVVAVVQKPTTIPKKSLFEMQLEGAKTTVKNPPLKKTPSQQIIQNKSPIKPTVNNTNNNNNVNLNTKTKLVQKTSPAKLEKPSEAKITKQVSKPLVTVNKSVTNDKKPLVNNSQNPPPQQPPPTPTPTPPSSQTNNKKLKLSPGLNDNKIDKTPPKKIIKKSPNVEISKKDKTTIESMNMVKTISTTSLKHPITNDKTHENSKRIKLSDTPHTNQIEKKESNNNNNNVEESSKDVDFRFMPQVQTQQKIETQVVPPPPPQQQPQSTAPTTEPVNLLQKIDLNLVKSILENANLKPIKENEPPARVPTPSPPPPPPRVPTPPNKKDVSLNNEEKLEEDELADLPPIKPKDVNDNSNDSLLIIDARSYRIQPDTPRKIKIYYHDHEIYCDTKTKDVYVDNKRVAKMGDNTKEIMLNGRRVRLMYMGKRVELWIDGMSFHLRADSPPKQINLSSSVSNQTKKYFVTIDSRTMDMYFNNFKVCNINGGPYGNGASILMARLAPDDYEQHEISFICPPKRIMIDGVPRKMRYDLPVPCIEMDNGQFHIIRFTGPPKNIYIDGQPYEVPFDKTVRIKLNGRAHELAWGGPGFEVIIDGRPYELQFNKPEREIIIGTRPHSVCIYGEAPDVKICGRLPKELCEKAQKTELKPITVKPPPLMSQPLPTPTDPSIIKAAETITNQIKIPNVHDLFQKLKDFNILPGLAKADKKDDDVKVPDLTNFDSELLKQKYTMAFKSLYSGVQCAECGNRFNRSENGAATSSSSTSRYAKHLDWHFRQNKKEKEEINKARSRPWYYNFKDWVLYEEISEDLVVSTDSQIHEDDMVRDNLQGDHAMGDDTQNRGLFTTNGIKTCPATDDIGDSCCICGDPFEIFWSNENEEWHFKDAIRVDNRIYHPICYKDNKEETEANNNNNQQTNTPVKSEPV
ncbi:unnamed protein product [Brachionus calyciflorus]|uniref:CID domain-containing protein n=1 Tax=Brachionus calyciflorus TaxID=104777 RepID=A0A814GUT3_9BILA|nr:unnamed protein product [Brachionus calyciflorus]